MVLAELIDIFERLSIPIGVVLAIIVVLVVPAFRKAVVDSYRAGRQSRQDPRKRMRKHMKSDKDGSE